MDRDAINFQAARTSIPSMSLPLPAIEGTSSGSRFEHRYAYQPSLQNGDETIKDCTMAALRAHPTRARQIGNAIKNLRGVLPFQIKTLNQVNVLKWVYYYIRFLQSQGPLHDDTGFFRWMLRTYAAKSPIFDFTTNRMSFPVDGDANRTFEAKIPNLESVYYMMMKNQQFAMTVDHRFITTGSSAQWVGCPDEWLRDYQEQRKKVFLEMADFYQRTVVVQQPPQLQQSSRLEEVPY